MTAMNAVMNTNLQSAPKSNNKRIKEEEGNSDFVTSLEKKIDQSSKNSSVDQQQEKADIDVDEKDIQKIENLLKGDLEKVDEDDLENIVSILNKIIKQLDLPNESLQGVKVVSDEVSQKSKGHLLLQNPLKELELIKERLTSLLKNSQTNEGKINIGKNLEGELSTLKELISNLKVKDISDSTSEKQRLIHHKAMNQSSIAKLSRYNQNKFRYNTNVRSEEESIHLNKKGNVEGSKILNIETNDNRLLSEGLEDVKTKNADNLVKDIDVNINHNILANESEVSNGINKLQSNKEVNFKNIVSQVNEKIDLTTVNKGKEITIELKPESLGRLHVKITLEEGHLSTKILAENGQVKELLEGNIFKLRESLSQKDLQIETLDVSTAFDGEDLSQAFSGNEHSAFNEEQSKNNSGKFNLDDLDELALTVEDTITEEAKGENNGLNDKLNYIV
ncbi:flagellar hook-length control protein FliK [Orenia marismortui]|uniref:flagellar hook-length control protein FliK n=1 Tax=Orenia marismortui TaxID=46469 RepID=UPI000369E3BE|nr:flagellar hook-length control protein FliK [Orenia marismortui]